MVGLGDLEHLFNPKLIYDSMKLHICCVKRSWRAVSRMGLVFNNAEVLLCIPVKEKEMAKGLMGKNTETAGSRSDPVLDGKILLSLPIPRSLLEMLPLSAKPLSQIAGQVFLFQRLPSCSQLLAQGMKLHRVCQRLTSSKHFSRSSSLPARHEQQLLQ